MRLHRFNGEHWYIEDRSIPRRLARWVVWPGGWETFRSRPMHERLHPGHWTPWSMFGHRLTCFGWGFQWRAFGGYWMAVWRPRSGLGVYFSPDGTPSSATVWLKGAPREVEFAAAEHRRERAAVACQGKEKTR